MNSMNEARDAGNEIADGEVSVLVTEYESAVGASGWQCFGN